MPLERDVVDGDNARSRTSGGQEVDCVSDVCPDLALRRDSTARRPRDHSVGTRRMRRAAPRCLAEADRLRPWRRCQARTGAEAHAPSSRTYVSLPVCDLPSWWASRSSLMGCGRAPALGPTTSRSKIIHTGCPRDAPHTLNLRARGSPIQTAFLAPGCHPCLVNAAETCPQTESRIRL